MDSLHSVILKLRSLNEAAISPTQGHHAQALLLKLISISDPRLADSLHDETSARPYTASTLQGKFSKAGKGHTVIRGGSYLVRFTFLNDALFAAFLDATLKEAGKTQRLESAEFHIEQVVMGEKEFPLCGHISYSGLAERAGTEREFRLRFLSPTAFRSAGKRNVIMPDASLVFGSYLARWTKFSPLKAPEGLEKVLKGMTLSRYKLQTRILHFTNYQEVGFEGECCFDVTGNPGEERLKWLNTLADFALYCGTGAKTTMGMGQTRRT
jgi:CRISPR-associated endoribonuclease Cas6